MNILLIPYVFIVYVQWYLQHGSTMDVFKIVRTNWRVRELHAYVRGREFCPIIEEGTLLMPISQLWLTLILHVLWLLWRLRVLHSGHTPLTYGWDIRKALFSKVSKAYRQSTKNIDSTKLLIHLETQKPLSVQQLSSYGKTHSTSWLVMKG